MNVQQEIVDPLGEIASPAMEIGSHAPYGQGITVGWESPQHQNFHSIISPLGSTRIPWENSPMVSPSTIGNPAMLLLFASPHSLTSPQASCIYLLDTFNLPWAVQEEIALAILSPTRGKDAIVVMNEAWNDLLEQYSTITVEKTYNVEEMRHDFALALHGSLGGGKHGEFMDAWIESPWSARPLGVLSLFTRLNAARTIRTALSENVFLGALEPPSEEDFGEIILRALEIPIVHRLQERGEGMLGVNGLTTQIWGTPPEMLRSLVNEHEEFYLDLIEEYTALRSEYNVEWANAAWEAPGNSAMLAQMRKLIQEN